MVRRVAVLVAASAIYGFSVGAAHSWLFAVRNLTKFPLLILVTTAVCSVCYYLFGLLLIRRIGFGDVLTTVLDIFKSISVLLASLSPVSLFVARTSHGPGRLDLGDYPLFLGLNIAFIAVCGTVVLIVEARRLLRRHGLSRRRTAATISVWLFLSVAVGGQWAWYLRPFFDVWSPGVRTPYCMGTATDFRGADSFYEAVYHLFDPP